MLERIFESLKQQNLAGASALIAVLFLVFIAHAPILPVVGGSVLAMGIIVWRGLSRPRRNSEARVGR